jgi:hypothetical protein
MKAIKINDHPVGIFYKVECWHKQHKGAEKNPEDNWCVQCLNITI